jgi:hypothetical protein
MAIYILLRRRNSAKRNVSDGSNGTGLVLNLEDRKRTERLIRRLKIWVVILICCLMFGLWSERNVPMWQLGVGCAINLTFMIGAVRAIRRLQKNLE